MSRATQSTAIPNRATLARFFSKVQIGPQCWNWLGQSRKRYGHFSLSHDISGGAHRLAYQWFVGPVPDGYEIDHLCRNPACVNPVHLEAVTKQENIRRAKAAAKPRDTKMHRFPIPPPALLNGKELQVALRLGRSKFFQQRKTGAFKMFEVRRPFGQRKYSRKLLEDYLNGESPARLGRRV